MANSGCAIERALRECWTGSKPAETAEAANRVTFRRKIAKLEDVEQLQLAGFWTVAPAFAMMKLWSSQPNWLRWWTTRQVRDGAMRWWICWFRCSEQIPNRTPIVTVSRFGGRGYHAAIATAGHPRDAVAEIHRPQRRIAKKFRNFIIAGDSRLRWNPR